MSLTLEEVRHIAELAKLELTAAEEALYQEQLSAILDYAGHLNAARCGLDPADGHGAAAAQYHAA